MNDTMIGQMYKNGQIGIVAACRMLYEQGYNRKNRREIMARWLTKRAGGQAFGSMPRSSQNGLGVEPAELSKYTACR